MDHNKIGGDLLSEERSSGRMRSNRGIVFVFLLALLLLSMGNMEMAEARQKVRMCKTPSSKFKGPCVSSSNCKNVCKTEGFPEGECDFHVASRKCYCYKPCNA